MIEPIITDWLPAFGVSLSNHTSLFYRPAQATIEVLRVLHGRRDIARIMRGEG